MAAIKQIKVNDIIYDIKAKQDINGNDITTTYVKNNGKQLSTEDFTTELKNKLDSLTNYSHPAGNAVSKPEDFYKISTDSNSHVASATPVTKQDITALGIPDQDTTYTEATTEAAGLMSVADKTKLDGIASGANNYVLPTAGASIIGGVKQGVAVANVDTKGGLEPTVDTVAAKINELLASLRNAGVIAN